MGRISDLNQLKYSPATEKSTFANLNLKIQIIFYESLCCGSGQNHEISTFMSSGEKKSKLSSDHIYTQQFFLVFNS